MREIIGQISQTSQQMALASDKLFTNASQIATGTEEVPDPDEGKDPAAVALGRKGGLKGGKARAEKLTAEQRSEIARGAAKSRWKDR